LFLTEYIFQVATDCDPGKAAFTLQDVFIKLIKKYFLKKLIIFRIELGLRQLQLEFVD